MIVGLLLGLLVTAGSAPAKETQGITLGDWHRIGPFRDQGPLLDWVVNVESGFKFDYDVEKETVANGGQPLLHKNYPAPNFPATPDALRSWTRHANWLDGYYQELPRGPAPSAGESQYVYRTITVEQDTEVELDFILRSPEADRRQSGLRTGRYKCLLNGKEIIHWNGHGDMPKARKVMLSAGVNHFLGKVTNNRHAYGFAFSITGLHPKLRHEVGFERMWRSHVKDLPTELPYHSYNAAELMFTEDQLYADGLKRLRAINFYPHAMPGVESAALDSKGRVVPAMEAELENYPTSPAGDRHTARLAELEKRVVPLLAKIDEATGDPMKDQVIAAVRELDQLWDETIKDLPKLIYLERETYVYDSMMYEGAGSGNASLKIFDPQTKKVETIVDFKAAKLRVRPNEFNLSWDGKTIFIGGGGMVSAIDSDGTNFRTITTGQSPSQMPDGRIIFFDNDSGQAPCKGNGSRRLLFICDPDGANRKLVSANNTIDTAPTVMNDGKIIFTRWDYGVNKNVFNRHALWTQNPDGSGIDLYYGNTVIDPRSLCRPRQIPGRPEILTIFGPHHAKLAGLLGLVWNGKGKESRDGLGFRRITQDTASVGDSPQAWSYQDSYPLNEQLFLVSFGGRRHNHAALYLYDRSGNRKCIIEGSNLGIHTAQPFIARTVPPLIPSRIVAKNWNAREDLHQRLLDDPDWTQKATLMLQDVYQGLEPEIQRGQIKYLAVMEQPAQSHGRGGAIGVGTIWYVNRFLGLVPVEKDGSALFEVPAMRSLFFHALDKDGKMLMTQGSDFHTMPGEVRSCIGCHEQRKGASAPPRNYSENPIALRKPPVHPELPDWGTRGVIEYETVVQPVFDKYCVSCHRGENPDGHLDLTGDRTTAYNMSYMQLTDGGHVHFQPGTGSTHAQPTNDSDEQAPLSRGSVISKLTKYIEDAEHCGKSISFDEQLRVFLWVDSNVPFFSHYRQVPPASLNKTAINSLRTVYARRCASCHNQSMPDTASGLNAHHIARHVGGPAGQWGISNSGMRVRHINLSNPSHSASALAPLAKDAGGWGLCGDSIEPVFKNKDDADYKKILSSIKDGIQLRKGIEVKGIKKLLQEEIAKKQSTRVSNL